MKILAWFENEANRATLYRLAVVLIPVAVGAGLLTDGQAHMVLTYAALVLGFGTTGLAVKHTKRKPKRGDHEAAKSAGA